MGRETSGFTGIIGWTTSTLSENSWVEELTQTQFSPKDKLKDLFCSFFKETDTPAVPHILHLILSNKAPPPLSAALARNLCVIF